MRSHGKRFTIDTRSAKFSQSCYDSTSDSRTPQCAHTTKDISTLTQQKLEDVLLQFVEDAIASFPIESLSDEQILALCNLQMTGRQQEEFSDLLAKNREGTLSHLEKQKLKLIMLFAKIFAILIVSSEIPNILHILSPQKNTSGGTHAN